MTPQEKAQKLLVFNENPELALFDELQELNATAREIADKPEHKCPDFPVIPEFPKIPDFPRIPELDMSETNELLKKLLDKDTKISVKLIIE